MSCDFYAKIVIMECRICLKQCLCCMFAKACFERLCVFIALILFFFHLLVKLFTLPTVFCLVNKHLQREELGNGGSKGEIGRRGGKELLVSTSSRECRRSIVQTREPEEVTAVRSGLMSLDCTYV